MNNINKFKDDVKSKLLNLYNIKWQKEVFESKKCTNYRIFKRELKFEKYLTILSTKLRVNFTRFRLSNHKLPIELGRHYNIERSQRKCHLCEVIGDEYHVIFECALFQEERDKNIDKKLHFRVNSIQYFDLFSNIKIVQLARLARFCKTIIEYYK